MQVTNEELHRNDTTAARSDIRILVVDDDSDLCDFLGSMLTLDGYRVEAIKDPKMALAVVKNFKPHIALLDLVMPEMDGLEILKRMKKEREDLLVIMFTGHPSVETAVQAIKLEAFDYIKKPIELNKLRKLIEKAAREKGLIIDPLEELLARIGKEIRVARKSAGLTLKDLAERTGLSVSLVSQIERAQTSPSIMSLYKLATALKIELVIS